MRSSSPSSPRRSWWSRRPKRRSSRRARRPRPLRPKGPRRRDSRRPRAKRRARLVAEPWLVAGLGNPGERYAPTRHNVGALVVAVLAERLGARLRKVRFLAVQAAEATHGQTSLLLVVPTA